MKRPIPTAFLLAAVMTAVSCHLLEDHSTLESVQLFFDESNVSVFEGGLGSVSLRVEPPDALTYKNVIYSIGNEDIASIYRADKRGCVFYGKREGSTVLTASVSDAEVKMVITVLPGNL